MLSSSYEHKKNSCNRGKLQIMADILSACASEGLKKTHVMYRANLSYDQINFYLTELLSSQLIAHLNSDHSSALYRTSEKGKEYLNSYRHLEHLILDAQKLSNLTDP